MTTLPLYENIWIPISIHTSEDIEYFTKKKSYFMKSIDICYFTSEIDFYTKNIPDLTEITINMPELDYNYIPCENTIFSTKTINDEESNTIVRIKLFPKKIVLYAFPFDPNTHYEFNIQLFMRIDSNRYESISS